MCRQARLQETPVRLASLRCYKAGGEEQHERERLLVDVFEGILASHFVFGSLNEWCIVASDYVVNIVGPL